MSVGSVVTLSSATSITSLGSLLRQLLLVQPDIRTIKQKNTDILINLPVNTVLSDTIKNQLQAIINGFSDTSTLLKNIEIDGDVIIKGNLIGQKTFSLSQNATFSSEIIAQGNVQLNVSSLSNSSVSKLYVDDRIVYPGTGITKVGQNFNINNNLSNVVSLGTLTSLSVNGTLNLLSTVDSTSSSTGSLILAGGAGISGSLNVTGNSFFNGTLTVISPTTNFHAATKGYVDSLISTAGTGLTKTGNVISVNNSQPLITSVGTLSLLTVAGITSLTNATTSTDFSSGALTVTGGVGIGGALNLGSTINVIGSSTFAGQVLISNTTPSVSVTTGALRISGGASITGDLYLNSSLRTFGQVYCNNTTVSTSATTGSVIISGGVGIVGAINQTGNLSITGNTNLTGTLNVTSSVSVPTPTTAFHAATKTYVDSNIATAGTGLTKTGTVFSVNTAQSQITSVGVLTGLSVSGTASITAAVISGAITIPAPVNDMHAATKIYVDGFIPTAGTGLTKTGNVFSVNTAQTQITSVGTLSGLSSSGIVNITNTTASSSNITGSLIVAGGVGVSGVLNLANDFNVSGTTTLTGAVNASNTISFTSAFNSSGVATFSGSIFVPTPVSNSHATTKLYVDGIISTAGTGLTKTGNIFSVDVAQPQVTSVGILTGLTSSGVLNVTNTTVSSSSTTGAVTVSGGVGIAGALYVAGSFLVSSPATFLGTVTVPSPTISTHVANRAYVDGLTYITAGTGLTKTGGTLSVNALQTQITSIGTLTGLTSSGVVNITNNTISTSSSTGALIITGGVGISGSVFVGGNLSVSGTVTVPTPVNGSDAVTKTYTDNLSYLTAGTGLTKTGGTLSVNALQTQITSVGTLTGLASSGVINITNTTVSTSVLTGALTVAGGLGISGSVFVGGNLSITGTVTVPTPVNGTDAVNKNYTDTLSYLTAGTGLTKTSGTLSVNALQTQITSIGTLTGLTSSGIVSISNNTASSSNTNGALTIAGGVGISGALNVGGNSIFTGTVTVGTPTVNTHAATKLYVDNLLATAGTGLTKTGTVFSVNASQTQITAVGTLTDLTVSGTSTFSGGLFISSFTGGSWINLPTTGPSGIGNGGAGANCFIGYAASAGHWFNNASAGDVCYRNGGAKILFGNSGSAASMAISGDLISMGHIAPTERLHVVGNVKVEGNIILKGSTSATTTLTSAATQDYTVTYPPTQPTIDGQFMAFTTTGTATFATPPRLYNGPNLVQGYKIWTGTVATNGGFATVYPTSTNASGGVPIFSTIYCATATAILDTTVARSVPLTSLKTISLTTVVFNVVTGVIANGLSNNPTLAYASNGMQVQIVIHGI